MAKVSWEYTNPNRPVVPIKTEAPGVGFQFKGNRFSPNNIGRVNAFEIGAETPIRPNQLPAAPASALGKTALTIGSGMAGGMIGNALTPNTEDDRRSALSDTAASIGTIGAGFLPGWGKLASAVPAIVQGASANLGYKSAGGVDAGRAAREKAASDAAWARSHGGEYFKDHAPGLTKAQMDINSPEFELMRNHFATAGNLPYEPPEEDEATKVANAKTGLGALPNVPTYNPMPLVQKPAPKDVSMSMEDAVQSVFGDNRQKTVEDFVAGNPMVNALYRDRAANDARGLGVWQQEMSALPHLANAEAQQAQIKQAETKLPYDIQHLQASSTKALADAGIQKDKQNLSRYNLLLKAMGQDVDKGGGLNLKLTALAREEANLAKTANEDDRKRILARIDAISKAPESAFAPKVKTRSALGSNLTESDEETP